jgi:hypothetical protein
VVEYNTSTNPTFEGAVRDTSGRGNDGILHSSVSYDANEKSFGSFGGGGLETMATNNLLESNGKHSFSAWIRFDTSGAWYAVYGIGGNIDNSGNNSITVYIGSGVFRVEANGGSYRDYGYTFNHGKWVHMAVVYDGTGGFDNFDIYMDTVKLSQGSSSDAGTAAITLPTQNQTVRFGSTAEESPGATSTNYLDGAMSSIKFYDTVLTAEEVKTLYDMGRCDEGHHVVNFSKTRVGIGLGDGEAPRAALDVRGDIYGGCPVLFDCVAQLTTNVGSYVDWNLVKLNKGGGLSGTTFTAPVAGHYFFHVHGMGAWTFSASEVRFVLEWHKNGVHYGITQDYDAQMYDGRDCVDADGFHMNVSGSIIAYLEIGETIQVIVDSTSTSTLHGRYNRFTGHYIG